MRVSSVLFYGTHIGIEKRIKIKPAKTSGGKKYLDGFWIPMRKDLLSF